MIYIDEILNRIKYCDIANIKNEWECSSDVLIKDKGNEIEVLKIYNNGQKDENTEKNVWIICVKTRNSFFIEPETFITKINNILNEKTKQKTFNININVKKQKECFLWKNCDGEKLNYLGIDDLRSIKYKSKECCEYKDIVINYFSEKDLKQSIEQFVNDVLHSDHQLWFSDEDAFDCSYSEVI